MLLLSFCGTSPAEVAPHAGLENDAENRAAVYGEGVTIAARDELPLFYFYDDALRKDLVFGEVASPEDDTTPTSRQKRSGKTDDVLASGKHRIVHTSVENPREYLSLDRRRSLKRRLTERRRLWGPWFDKGEVERRLEGDGLIDFEKERMALELPRGVEAEQAQTQDPTAAGKKSDWPAVRLPQYANVTTIIAAATGTVAAPATTSTQIQFVQDSTTPEKKEDHNVALVICGSAEKRFYNIRGRRIVDYEQMWSVGARAKRYLLDASLYAVKRVFVFLCGWPDLEVVERFGDETGPRSEAGQSRSSNREGNPIEFAELRRRVDLGTFAGQFEHLDMCFRGVRQFEQLQRDSQRDSEASQQLFRFSYFIRLRPDIILYDDFPRVDLFPRDRVALRAVNVVSNSPGLFEDATPLLRRQYCNPTRESDLGEEHSCRVPKYFSRQYAKTEAAYDDSLDDGGRTTGGTDRRTRLRRPQIRTTESALQDYREYLDYHNVPLCSGLDDQVFVAHTNVADAVFLDGRWDRAYGRDLRRYAKRVETVVENAGRMLESRKVSSAAFRKGHWPLLKLEWEGYWERDGTDFFSRGVAVDESGGGGRLRLVGQKETAVGGAPRSAGLNPDFFVRDWNRTAFATSDSAIQAFFGRNGGHFAMEKCEPYILPTGIYMRKRDRVTATARPLRLPSPSRLSFAEQVYDEMNPLGFNDNESVFTIRMYARQIPAIIVPISASLISFTNRGRAFQTPELVGGNGSGNTGAGAVLPPAENILDDLQWKDAGGFGGISPGLRRRMEVLARFGKDTAVAKAEERRGATDGGVAAVAPSSAEDEAEHRPVVVVTTYCPADADYDRFEEEKKGNATLRSLADVIADPLCRALYAEKMQQMGELGPRPAMRRISKLTGGIRVPRGAEL
eukprot:g19598.t1